MTEIIAIKQWLPLYLVQFVFIALLSFIIGLEFHNYRRLNKPDLGFGTSRTLTLTGILGYTLYIIDTTQQAFFIGLCGLFLFMALYYFKRYNEQRSSLLSPLIATFTYLLAPIVIKFPYWFSVMYVALILVILSAKPKIRSFSNAIDNGEVITFTKFLVMVGIILPLLPTAKIASVIPVTYYQVWLALLVVSGVSYASYLINTYWLKNNGLIITGIIGGIYSSTVTTAVLARRSREIVPDSSTAEAIILATSMMYIRLLAIVFLLGHVEEGLKLLGPFAFFILLTSMAALILHFQSKKTKVTSPEVTLSHPLEFHMALLFSFLFVAFSVLTAYVVVHFGNEGLKFLSFIVGLTDVDPFILSLLGGNYSLASSQIVAAIIIAAGSNNLMKAIYAASIGRNKMCYKAALVLSLSGVVSIFYGLLVF